MASATRLMHLVDEAPAAGGQAVEEVYIDGLKGGGGDAPTTIPTGALVPGAGIDLARDADTGVITASVKAKGVTAAMLADGVAVSGPKGADGKSVTALALTTDATGKVTGGTVTFSDKTTAAVTVTTATA